MQAHLWRLTGFSFTSSEYTDAFLFVLAPSPWEAFFLHLACASRGGVASNLVRRRLCPQACRLPSRSQDLGAFKDACPHKTVDHFNDRVRCYLVCASRPSRRRGLGRWHMCSLPRKRGKLLDRSLLWILRGAAFSRLRGFYALARAPFTPALNIIFV